jgi:hypothetical protein
MSMREYPGSAYVLPVEKVLDHLSEDKRNQLKSLIEKDDTEAIDEFLVEFMPDDWPQYESIYRPSDEDTVDDETMEPGHIYILFNEEDLYVKTPTDAMKNLHKLGLTPTILIL